MSGIQRRTRLGQTRRWESRQRPYFLHLGIASMSPSLLMAQALPIFVLFWFTKSKTPGRRFSYRRNAGPIRLQRALQDLLRQDRSRRASLVWASLRLARWLRAIGKAPVEFRVNLCDRPASRLGGPGALVGPVSRRATLQARRLRRFGTRWRWCRTRVVQFLWGLRRGRWRCFVARDRGRWNRFGCGSPSGREYVVNKAHHDNDGDQNNQGNEETLSSWGHARNSLLSGAPRA